MASGNTSAKLREAGIAHSEVAEVTGSPEMLGGRVKTLHPKIHGGILADRSKSEHLADLEANGIEPIDLVVVNLYPFSSDPSIELIDVGGPTMVRAGGQEPRARRRGHVARGLRRRARGAARIGLAAPRPRDGGWPVPPSRTRRPTTRRSWRGSTAGGPTPVDELEGASDADVAEA